MPIKMEEFTKVFPRRVNIDQYKALFQTVLDAMQKQFAKPPENSAFEPPDDNFLDEMPAA